MKNRTIKQQKQSIARVTKRLESDFINAKNDLFRVQALNEMEDVLTAEILKWDEFLVQNSTSNKDEDEKMILAVQKEKKDLQSVVDMIDTERKPMLDNAKAIYNAMVNSHQNVAFTRHVSPGKDINEDVNG